MKNKLNKILLLITTVGIVSCRNAITEKDLVLNDNLYYETNSTVPFSGRVLSRFSSGEISSMYYLKSGFLMKSESYGYANELISQTVYEEIKEVIESDNHISRILFTTSNEGPVFYYGIEVILNSNSSFDLSAIYNNKDSIIKTVIEKNGLPEKTELITFSVKKGELEESLYKEEILLKL